MRTLLLPLAALLVAGAGCASNKPVTSAPVAAVREVPPELTNPDFIYAVLRHLYRWHFNGATFVQPDRAGQIEVWVRSVNVKADEGDRSRFAEMWLPGAGLLVDLKQADDEVSERKLVVKDSGFKVRAVEHPGSVPQTAASWRVLRFPAKDVEAHLFQTRQERLFPDAAMESRLEKALADYLSLEHEHEMTNATQTFYVAPISPVSNELWVFWENRHLALHFTADGDLADARLWEQIQLNLRVVSLEQNVAVSRDEMPDGGRFVSRDWAGRLVYNCVVLGRKFTLRPE